MNEPRVTFICAGCDQQVASEALDVAFLNAVQLHAGHGCALVASHGKIHVDQSTIAELTEVFAELEAVQRAGPRPDDAVKPVIPIIWWETDQSGDDEDRRARSHARLILRAGAMVSKGYWSKFPLCGRRVRFAEIGNVGVSDGVGRCPRCARTQAALRELEAQP